MQLAVTVDAIKMELPSRNTVSLALDVSQAMHTHRIMSVIAYYMNPNWALREFQLTLDEVDRLFSLALES
jgi:hypothetical protein